jgi:PAS domain S-box-containing protein
VPTWAAPRESDSVIFTEWQSWRHPEDRERMLGTLRESLAREDKSTADYRVVRADGQTRWISYRGRITRDATGSPVRMLGAVQDVTDRKRAEEELHRVTPSCTPGSGS